jgi:hypothetical protein
MLVHVPTGNNGANILLGVCRFAFLQGHTSRWLVQTEREVSDTMFRVAAECLADQLSLENLGADALHPPG